MNNKIAKKVGEAYAFANVLDSTFSQNKSVIKELTGEMAETIDDTVQKQKDDLLNIATGTQMDIVVTEKAAKTSQKIIGMGETYVGDDWDDAAEVLEWLSFFVGGAIIHWSLIAGAGKASGHNELEKVAAAGTTFYEDMLAELKRTAAKIGADRSEQN